jgi:hypothetical protein
VDVTHAPVEHGRSFRAIKGRRLKTRWSAPGELPIVMFVKVASRSCSTTIQPAKPQT